MRGIQQEYGEDQGGGRGRGPPNNTFLYYISVHPPHVQIGQGNTQKSHLFNLVREQSCPTSGWKHQMHDV